MRKSLLPASSLLAPALFAAALVATPALAVDLGVKTGAGVGVQARPVNAGASAATDANAGTDLRGAARGARDTGTRAAREVGGRVSSAAQGAQDVGVNAARDAGRAATAVGGAASTQIKAVGAGAHGSNAHGVEARTDARVNAQGSLQASDRAKAAVGAHAGASGNAALDAPATTQGSGD